MTAWSSVFLKLLWSFIIISWNTNISMTFFFEWPWLHKIKWLTTLENKEHALFFLSIKLCAYYYRSIKLFSALFTKSTSYGSAVIETIAVFSNVVCDNCVLIRRDFHLVLFPSTSLFTKNHTSKHNNGTSDPVDLSFIYDGTVEGILLINHY